VGHCCHKVFIHERRAKLTKSGCALRDVSEPKLGKTYNLQKDRFGEVDIEEATDATGSGAAREGFQLASALVSFTMGAGLLLFLRVSPNLRRRLNNTWKTKRISARILRSKVMKETKATLFLGHQNAF
jgi:hypothetical protein